jgi:hypothetical protein
MLPLTEAGARQRFETKRPEIKTPPNERDVCAQMALPGACPPRLKLCGKSETLCN